MSTYILRRYESMRHSSIPAIRSIEKRERGGKRGRERERERERDAPIPAIRSIEREKRERGRDVRLRESFNARRTSVAAPLGGESLN